MDTEIPEEATVWGVAKYPESIFHELAREREVTTITTFRRFQNKPF
jgi:hypothetical protein